MFKKYLLLCIVMIRSGRNRMNVTTRRVSRRRWRILSPLLPCLAVSLPVFGAEVNLPDATDLSEHGITQADLSDLDQIMINAVNAGTFSGCSYIVAHKGEIVYREAHGNFTTGESVGLASVSKPFAASAILAMADDNKVNLYTPIENYLPEYVGMQVVGGAVASPKITTSHLLSHMAGFWGNKKTTAEKRDLIRNFSRTLEEMSLLVAELDLDRHPGNLYAYSGTGYCIAGRVAEAAFNDTSFETLCQTYLWGPLGMNQTSYNPTPSRPFILVGGTMSSSLDDMAVFDQMHLRGGTWNGTRVLEAATVTDQRSLHTQEELPRSYGYGWFRDYPDGNGAAQLLYHSGATGPNMRIDHRRQTVTAFLVRSTALNALSTIEALNQRVEQMFPVTNDR
jgi:CubicO group peptidase (beta-lactamase class C family)